MKLPQGLPTLTGRWFTAYRILWWVMLALAVAALTWGTWESRRQSSQDDRVIYGAGVRLTIVGDRLKIAPLGDETRDRFPPDSELVAVDGRPVSAAYTEANRRAVVRALDGIDDERLMLVIRAPDGTLSTVGVRRGPRHLAQSDRDAPLRYDERAVLYLASELLSSVLVLVTAIMLFRRRSHDPVVALLSLGLLCMIAGPIIPLLDDGDLGEMLWRSSGAATGTAILLAITVFPTGRFDARWSLLILPLLLLLAITNLWPALLGSWQWIVGLPTFMMAAAAPIRRYWTLPAGIERQQIKWAVLGIAGLIAAGLLGELLRWIDRQVIDNQLHFVLQIAERVLWPMGIAMLSAGLLVSLLRYRLYDADAAISRSATLAALTLSLIAVFAGTEKLIETLGEQWFGGSAGSAAGAIAAGLAAVLLVPMHRRLDAWAERRFQRNLVSLRKLPDLVGDLRETASLERLADTALDRVVTTLRATGGAIVLGDGTVVARHGDGDNHPVRVPLDDDACGHVGELRLGPRPDGTLYGKDEREALDSVIGPLARAIAIVRERGEAETRWQRLVSDLRENFEDRLRALEARVPPTVAAK